MHAKLRSALSLLSGADATLMQSIVGEELAQGPYVAARVGGIRTHDPSNERRGISHHTPA